MIFSFTILIFFSCKKNELITSSPENIIPLPQQIEKNEGIFSLSANMKISFDPIFKNEVLFLNEHLKKYFGQQLSLAKNDDNSSIEFIQDNSFSQEEYELEVDHKIMIRAKTPTGAFWAIQSLLQMIPLEYSKKYDVIIFQKIKIKDQPQFSYRGMHLDVARHFFDTNFIKEYISHLAMLKMNYFHWHLTEDQGWRIEIKKYPKLTSHAAYRDETLIGHYNDTPQQFDGKKYGGFYTQEDIKEIIQHAERCHVTIIPEIELPGHAQAAISAYPELSCHEDSVSVATKWGVFENIYCPTEKTFSFLEDVLTEVIELFPGKYIHIGGDEVPKKQWKESNYCQKLIQKEKLKDEHELQSYFIKRIEKFINSKGKKIIGWDEILEGGLAPNATVMSWRGYEGAIQAAKKGHDVILTPTSHAYFDYYQAEHKDEPLAIGGFLPLKKVFSFNPYPHSLDEDKKKYVLGAQGNIWTEYMPTTDQVEYMAFPRILAMSEVVWNGASKNIEKEYPIFLHRVEHFFSRLETLKINYANHIYDLSGRVLKRNNKIYYELSTPIPNKKIMYTINGIEQEYISKIPIEENTKIEATVILDDNKRGRTFSEVIHFHKGINTKLSINVDPHSSYNAGGIEALHNGISGSDHRYGDKEWLGFWGDDVNITFYFIEPISFSNLKTRFYNANGQWIYAPKEMTIQGYLFEEKIINEKINIISSEKELQSNVNFENNISDKKINQLTISIPNYGIIPEGLQGAGHPAWTFIDEIIIE